MKLRFVFCSLFCVLANAALGSSLLKTIPYSASAYGNRGSQGGSEVQFDFYSGNVLWSKRTTTPATLTADPVPSQFGSTYSITVADPLSGLNSFIYSSMQDLSAYRITQFTNTIQTVGTNYGGVHGDQFHVYATGYYSVYGDSAIPEPGVLGLLLTGASMLMLSKRGTR